MIYKVAFNLFLRERGFDNQFIGTIASYEMIGSAILGLVIAVLGDRFGKKRVLVGISFGFGLVLILKVSFPIPAFLLSIAFLSGGLQMSRMMLLNSLLIDLTDHGSRGKAFGLNFGVQMGSGLFGNFIGGVLGEQIGMTSTLIIAALLYILSNVFLAKIPNIKPGKLLPLRVFFDIRGLLPAERSTVTNHLLETFFVSFGAGLFVNFGNIIFKDLFDLSPTMIGTALSIAQLGAGIGSVLSWRLARRYGAVSYVGLLTFLVVPLIIALGFIRDPYIFTVFYAVRFSFMNMTNPVVTTCVLSNVPADRVTAINSIKNTLNHISRAIAAAVFGLIVALPSGYTILFLLSSVFYALGFFFLMRVLLPLKRAGKLQSLYGGEKS